MPASGARSASGRTVPLRSSAATARRHAAVSAAETGAPLLGALRGFERAIEARLNDAKAAGELDAAADPAALAMIASSVLHSIAVRSRAGEPRAALKALTDTAIQLICGNFQPISTSARPTKKPA